MAERTIVAPADWKTASNEAVKLEPWSRIRNRKSSNRALEIQRQVAGLLDRPPPGRVARDAAQVHPAGAVLNEYQHVQPCQQHRVNVEKVDGQDPGGLGVQELPPRRA